MEVRAAAMSDVRDGRAPRRGDLNGEAQASKTGFGGYPRSQEPMLKAAGDAAT
jgi:hypothetical protein